VIVSESGEWFNSFRQSLPETATFRQLLEFPFVFVLTSQVMFKGEKPFPSEIPFGLEIGTGNRPTKVYNVDQQLPWILTECNSEEFKKLIEDLPTSWEDAPLENLPEPIILIPAFATLELQLQANFLIYRNPNYEHKDFFMVNKMDLRSNQKLMLIVSDTHTNELDRYRELLRKHGYNDSNLRQRSSSEVSLSFPLWENPVLKEDPLYRDEYNHVYSFEVTGSDPEETP